MSVNTHLFFWHECLTPDTEKAAAFYAAVVGYTPQPWPDPSMEYTVLSMGGDGVGGVAELAADAREMGVPPHWMGTVSVADADAIAARARELGGRVYMEPTDMPGVGRFAVLADPTGATFGILCPSDASSTPVDRDGLGRVSWNELWSADPAASWAFFQALFGWVETGTMDMGEMGLYRMYGREGDGRSMGGIAAKTPQMPASHWLFYLNVADADAAVAGVEAAGGKVVHGPHDVPGGGRTVQAVDDQGARFAVYSHTAAAT